MIEDSTSLFKVTENHFTHAKALLSKGDFTGFMDEVILLRSLLKAALQDPSPSQLLTEWRELNDLFECLFEWHMGSEVLKGKKGECPWDKAESPNFLGARADLEAFRSLRRDRARQLVLAGSGAFPQTLFFLARHSSIENLVGLDFNPERAFFSSTLAKHCGLGERISFVVGDACSFDYKATDIVIVASLVCGKKSVVSRIAETANPGTVVCVREPRGWGRLFYEEVDSSFLCNPRLQPLQSWIGAKDSLFQTSAFEVLPQGNCFKESANVEYIRSIFESGR